MNFFRNLALAVGLAVLPAAAMAQAATPGAAAGQTKRVERSDTAASHATHHAKPAAASAKRAKAHRAAMRRTTQRAKPKAPARTVTPPPA